MEKEQDDVSSIHNRFSLTLVNPGSHYFSLAASMGVGVVIVLATYFGYFNNLSIEEFWYRIPMVLGSLAVIQVLDTRFTKKKEYSKSLHSSLFGNMLWVVTILMGILSSIVLGKNIELFFITFGMILFASFRIGIYTTTLGLSLKKAWAIAFIQPLVMFFALIPQESWYTIRVSNIKKYPNKVDSNDPVNTPILTPSIYCIFSAKAKFPTKRLIVKPIPVRTPTP